MKSTYLYVYCLLCLVFTYTYALSILFFHFQAWQISFLLTALLAMLGTIMFLVFGYGDLLPWTTVSDANKAIDDADCEANSFKYRNLKDFGRYRSFDL